MITDSHDYEEMLWRIQNNTPPRKALLLPKDEKIFDIDLNTRKINVPKFLSVAKDHEAETIYFKFDRYFDYIDLTSKACVIQYINAKGDSYIYPVPYYDTQTLVNEGKVIIPWCIQGAATEEAGTIKFAIRWYEVNAEKRISYSFNTLIAEGKILEGQHTIDNPELSMDTIQLSSELIDTIYQIQEDLNNNQLTLYWLDV